MPATPQSPIRPSRSAVRRTAPTAPPRLSVRCCTTHSLLHPEIATPHPVRFALASLLAALPLAALSSPPHAQLTGPSPAGLAPTIDSIVQTEIITL